MLVRGVLPMRLTIRLSALTLDYLALPTPESLASLR
jgi:hypothetical protein